MDERSALLGQLRIDRTEEASSGGRWLWIGGAVLLVAAGGVLAWFVTVFAGLTMVSNLKYYSFKTINLRRSVPFLAIFSIVLFFVLVSYQPAIVLFAGFVIYALAGYVWSGWLALKRRRS